MKIAIAGYGVEGKANFSYWNRPENDITIVDERESLDGLPENVKTLLGPGSFEQLGDFDLVVRTAGLAPHKIKTNGKIWSSTNEFFAKCPAPIIGVTGTKGKGTTCSLIASILAAEGKNTHLVGNIGTPALAELDDIKADDIVVFELSSFQLWDVKKSPHIAVVLMIEPDHLDVHSSLDDYIDAKANIVRFQSVRDTVIFNTANEYSRGIGEASRAEKHPYQSDNFASAHDGSFWYNGEEIFPFGALQLLGAHNIENTCAAINAVKAFTATISPGVIQQGVRDFTGLPHRLKFVAEKHGVKFYDDSIATTPGSAIAAIKSFSGPKVLILGGAGKGADYTELVKMCQVTDTSVVAVGRIAPDITQLCSEMGVVHHMETGNMSQIVASAARLAKPGGVVILSPAATSFDMFKNYADRGDQFIAAVEKL